MEESVPKRKYEERRFFQLRLSSAYSHPRQNLARMAPESKDDAFASNLLRPPDQFSHNPLVS
jgi:hypothetical protein